MIKIYFLVCFLILLLAHKNLNDMEKAEMILRHKQYCIEYGKISELRENSQDEVLIISYERMLLMLDGKIDLLEELIIMC